MALRGGSESEVKDTYTHGFFHEGVDSYVVRASQPIELRILPGFDMTQKPGTDKFQASVSPYRDRSAPEDYYTKTPGFSNFYYAVSGYTWYGNNKLSFLSPLTGGSNNRSGICPAADVYKYCHKNDDAALHALTESKSKSEPATIVRTRVFGLMNCYMRDPKTNEEGNKVLIATGACLNQLKKRLSMRAGREDPIITEGFKEFLYGDVTDPATGSTAFVRETHIEDNPALKFAGLFFSDKDGYLEGRREDSFDPTKGKGKDMLTNRYDISDTDNVTKLHTYDDVLELLVSDGAIPYNVIERACSRYAENGIPSAPSGVVAVTPVMPTPKPKVEKDPDLEEEVPMEDATPAAQPVEETQEDIKAVETTTTKLEPEDEERFWALHKQYEANHGDMTGEDLSDYFTLRIKSGVKID